MAAGSTRKPRPRGPQLDLAGDLSVAFVNTAAARDNNAQRAVRSYSDLVLWGLESGTLHRQDLADARDGAQPVLRQTVTVTPFDTAEGQGACDLAVDHALFEGIQ